MIQQWFGLETNISKHESHTSQSNQIIYKIQKKYT